MNIKPAAISASMMCADLRHINETLALLEQEHVEYLHIDVMDGEFVPNFGLGIDYMRRLREMTSIPLDIHLMVCRPEDKLAWLNLCQTDRVSIHYEGTYILQRTIEQAKRFGPKVMLAINPATPIYSVEEILEYIDGVQVLTVNPGFAGQRIVGSCINKTERLRKFMDERGYPDLDIEVDGNISYENAGTLRKLGANIFVAGTASIFSREGTVTAERIRSLREAVR